jgi:hypothetical protein
MSKLEKVVLEAIEKQVKESGLDKSSIEKAIKSSVDKYIDKSGAKIEKKILDVAKKEMHIPKKIKIELPKAKGGDKEKITHKQFDALVKIIQSGLPVLMVGEPGTGKTSSAEMAAELLGIDFHSISVGVQTTKSDILGFTDAGGTYQPTGFRKAFENGGIFLMDEIDAGNPNVLIIINSAISNGFCNFPDGMIHAHEKFRFVATANTFGTGADAKFIGRNQLDEATLDRFINIKFGIDELLEDALVSNKDWLKKVRTLRKDVEYSNRDILVSPRISIYGSQLIESGFSEYEATEMTILKGKDDDTKKYVLSTMNVSK